MSWSSPRACSHTRRAVPAHICIPFCTQETFFPNHGPLEISIVQTGCLCSVSGWSDTNSLLKYLGCFCPRPHREPVIAALEVAMPSPSFHASSFLELPSSQREVCVTRKPPMDTSPLAYVPTSSHSSSELDCAAAPMLTAGSFIKTNTQTKAKIWIAYFSSLPLWKKKKELSLTMFEKMSLDKYLVWAKSMWPSMRLPHHFVIYNRSEDEIWQRNDATP